MQPEDVKGKFPDWETRASYIVRVTIILQVDATNVSSEEYSVAPNLTAIGSNQAIVNIYQNWSFTGSFEEFRNWYAMQEATLQHYAEDLLLRLNAARQRAGFPGNWYINYGLNERHIECYRV